MSKEALARMEAEFLDRLFKLRGAIKSPTCDICNKTVDKFGVSFKPIPMHYVFEIECHGDKGQMYIQEEMALDPTLDLVVNKAFTPDQQRIDGIVKGMIQ